MNTKLIDKMIQYYRQDPKRVQHFTKVYCYAKLIGLEEQLDSKTQYILETAAVVHDIGIKISEQLHGIGVCDGKKQELYGPAEAEKLLRELGESSEVVERVSYLVGHHHTYNNVDGPDYQILLEADFIVNAYEDALPVSAVQMAYDKLFRTESGKRILREMYLSAGESFTAE